MEDFRMEKKNLVVFNNVMSSLAYSLIAAIFCFRISLYILVNNTSLIVFCAIFRQKNFFSVNRLGKILKDTDFCCNVNYRSRQPLKNENRMHSKNGQSPILKWFIFPIRPLSPALDRNFTTLYSLSQQKLRMVTIWQISSFKLRS